MIRSMLFTRVHLAAGLALALTGSLVGCGQQSPTAPIAELGASRIDRSGLDQNGVVTGTFSSLGWNLVASKSIGSAGGTVSGSRYTLTFPANALTSSKTITISERSSRILDAEFGPAGLLFSKPVTLVMSYAGTNADPASSSFDGTVPAYFQFDTATMSWKSIAGTLNTSARTFTVQISCFNPGYAVTGVGGIIGQTNGIKPPGGIGTGDW